MKEDLDSHMYNLSLGGSERIRGSAIIKGNARYVALCAQPPGLDDEAANAQAEVEYKEWAKSVYFGVAACDIYRYRSVDRNLPISDPRDFSPSVHHIYMAKVLPSTSSRTLIGPLPPEIVNLIVSRLDIDTIDNLKAVSRLAFDLVYSHALFKVVNEDAHDTLRSIRAIRAGHCVTIQDLYDVLCEKSCVVCGSFGGLLYIPRLERLCAACFENADWIVPFPAIAAVQSLGLIPAMLDQLPHFQTYPGAYGGGDHFPVLAKDYARYVDRRAALQAGIALHGSAEAVDQFPSRKSTLLEDVYHEYLLEQGKKRGAERRAKRREIRARHERRGECHPTRLFQDGRVLDELSTEAAAPFKFGSANYLRHYRTPAKSAAAYTRKVDKEPAVKPPSGEDCAICADFGDDELGDKPTTIPSRWHGVTRAPWLNRATHRAEWGFHCLGCVEIDASDRHSMLGCTAKSRVARRRQYIASTFAEHLEACGPLIRGVHHVGDCCSRRACPTPTRMHLIHRSYWRA